MTEVKIRYVNAVNPRMRDFVFKVNEESCFEWKTAVSYTCRSYREKSLLRVGPQSGPTFPLTWVQERNYRWKPETYPSPPGISFLLKESKLEI